MSEDGIVPAAATRRAAGASAKKTPAKKAATKTAGRAVTRWSAAREKAFLAALAETANVAASARKAKLAESTVYRHRQADPDFAARSAVALREGYLKLESMLLARALGGVTRPVWYGGKKVGAVREFDDRLGLQLLNQHRAAVTGSRDPPEAPIPIEEARARFKARLAEMNRRLGGSG